MALNAVLTNKRELIQKNRIISAQIEYLYDQLLEKNIIKLVNPYYKVQVEYLTQKLQVEGSQVEKKICEMILDKKILGYLDQENGLLILLEEEKLNSIY